MTITIDTKLLFTKSEYSRAFGVNRATLDKKIKDREIKSIAIRGTTLVVAQQG